MHSHTSGVLVVGRCYIELMKKGNGKNKLAWVVSRVFDPIFEIPFLLVLTAWVALTNGLRWRFIVFLLFFDALLPAAYFIIGLKTKKIADWDLTRKEDRRGIYTFTALVHFFGVVYAYFLGKTELAGVLFVLWSLAVVFAGITYFWKISVHAGVNGVMLALLTHYYGWDRFGWLAIVLFLVIWARVKAKKHTWAQVLAGAGLAIAWVEIGLRVW